jgi:hypothetical protein
MRRTTIWIFGATAVAVTGCGGGSSTFKNKPRPPAPVNLTVYINNQQVSISPASLGAGPVVFIVTNQATHAQSLQIQPAGSGSPLADTGPIYPQATAQVKVDLSTEGDYSVTTAGAGGSAASSAAGTGIHPATLHIGPPRPNGNNLVLQP